MDFIHIRIRYLEICSIQHENIILKEIEKIIGIHHFNKIIYTYTIISKRSSWDDFFYRQRFIQQMTHIRGMLNILILNYDIVEKWSKYLKSLKPRVLIIDEGHYIKYKFIEKKMRGNGLSFNQRHVHTCSCSRRVLCEVPTFFSDHVKI